MGPQGAMKQPTRKRGRERAELAIANLFRVREEKADIRRRLRAAGFCTRESKRVLDTPPAEPTHGPRVGTSALCRACIDAMKNARRPTRNR